MAIFAELSHLDDRHLLAWLVVGLAAGWLAALAKRGSLAGDIALGLAGAFIAGLLFSGYSHGPQPLASTIVAAFVGASVLLVIGRAFTGRRARA
ncbi:MAG: GlsB/YeaQ/YmgE family stress response membrane protein [Gemmataceae bacterium]|nr:GlsB/YeaQ/YmgE family stress response membrane protein [Gemmataceae bacterium]